MCLNPSNLSLTLKYVMKNSRIAVESNKSFEYLGKKFNFEMKTNKVQEELEKRVISYLTVIDKLPLHPKFKIQVLTGYIFSKIRWTLMIYDIPITWLKQKSDSSILY